MSSFSADDEDDAGALYFKGNLFSESSQCAALSNDEVYALLQKRKSAAPATEYAHCILSKLFQAKIFEI